MKFQNPSFKFFLNGRTNKRTDSQKQYAPHFFKVGGIMMTNREKLWYMITVFSIVVGRLIEFIEHCSFLNFRFDDRYLFPYSITRFQL